MTFAYVMGAVFFAVAALSIVALAGAFVSFVDGFIGKN